MTTTMMDTLYAAADQFSALVSEQIERFTEADWSEIQRTATELHPVRLGTRAELLGRAGYVSLEMEMRNATIDSQTLMCELSRLQALHNLAAMHGLTLEIRREPGALDPSLWLLTRLAFNHPDDQPELVDLVARVMRYYAPRCPDAATELLGRFCASEAC